MDFGSVEQLWMHFWSHRGHEETLPLSLFHSLCSLNFVQEFVKNADYHLYQQAVQKLIGDILSHMPSASLSPLPSRSPARSVRV